MNSSTVSGLKWIYGFCVTTLLIVIVGISFSDRPHADAELLVIVPLGGLFLGMLRILRWRVERQEEADRSGRLS